MTETSGKQYVLWTLDCRCFPRLRLGKHRQSLVHKTYCFPRSQSISVNYSPCLRKSLITFTNLNRGYNLRNDETYLALPKPKTNFLKRSFKYSASMLWNNLSYEAKTATSLRQFKQNIANCCL